uniref:Uncharacterized protein n=1 Tax=Rhizophora mucronata TaxID=61149 RepID=A0A2P2N987_RHIMU
MHWLVYFHEFSFLFFTERENYLKSVFLFSQSCFYIFQCCDEMKCTQTMTKVIFDMTKCIFFLLLTSSSKGFIPQILRSNMIHKIVEHIFQLN